jgi:transcription elongation factor Elf1
MGEKSRQTRVQTYYIDSELKRDFQAICDSEIMSMSTVMGQLIRAYVNQHVNSLYCQQCKRKEMFQPKLETVTP